jgi:RHS repeat-associated protein
VVTATNPAFANPFQFTGRENDGLAGLYYYRARYYDSDLRRFISEDPIGTRGGPNLYAYAANNPVSFSDPLGLQPSAQQLGVPPVTGLPAGIPGSPVQPSFPSLAAPLRMATQVQAGFNLAAFSQLIATRVIQFADTIECGRAQTVIVCYKAQRPLETITVTPIPIIRAPDTVCGPPFTTVGRRCCPLLR